MYSLFPIDRANRMTSSQPFVSSCSLFLIGGNRDARFTTAAIQQVFLNRSSPFMKLGKGTNSGFPRCPSVPSGGPLVWQGRLLFGLLSSSECCARNVFSSLNLSGLGCSVQMPLHLSLQPVSGVTCRGRLQEAAGTGGGGTSQCLNSS